MKTLGFSRRRSRLASLSYSTLTWETKQEHVTLHLHNFIGPVFTRYYYDDQLTDVMIGEACSKHGAMNMYEMLVSEPEGERLLVRSRIILKWIQRYWVGGCGHYLCGWVSRPFARSCENCNGNSGFIKGGKFLVYLSDYRLRKKNYTARIRLQECDVGHCSLSECIWYKRHFGSWLYSSSCDWLPLH